MARESSNKVDPENWADEYGDCLYWYALMRVRNHEVAEDLVHETLFAAVRKCALFRGSSSERSCLYGILTNKIFGHFRRLAQEVSFIDLESLEDKMSSQICGPGLESRALKPGRSIDRPN
jgi:DNA-directed RNA polymerase specialized sigma24 family protein